MVGDYRSALLLCVPSAWPRFDRLLVESQNLHTVSLLYFFFYYRFVALSRRLYPLLISDSSAELT
jgi:hypothetical protein